MSLNTNLLKKLLPTFSSALVWGIVMWQIEPPKTLTEASIFQFLMFFLPLFLFLFFLTNIFLHKISVSLVIGGGGVILLLLQGTNNLNLLTLPGTAAIIFILLKILIKPKKIFYQAKIPKLSHLSQQK